MDFKYTKEQEAIKEEFEEFFKEEMKHSPPEYGRGGLEGMFATDEGWNFHRSIAKKLGENGKQKIHSEFSAKIMVEKTAHLYRGVCCDVKRTGILSII